MNLKDLRCFRQVYQEKSITKAAQKLYITPQGLSKNIRNLEDEMGTVLFIRTNHGVQATESAKLLAQKVNHLIGEFEEIEQDLRHINGESNYLKIGYACGTFQLMPLRLFQKFSLQNPQVNTERCEYSNAEVKNLLLDRKLDYGFIVGDWDNVHVSTKLLNSCSMVVLIYEGHLLYTENSLSLKQMEKENFILMNEKFHMYRDIMDACNAQDFYPNVIAKTTDGTFLQTLCRQREGLAIVPECFVESFNMEGLKAVPLLEKITWDVYGAYEKGNSNIENIKKFEAFLSSDV